MSAGQGSQFWVMGSSLDVARHFGECPSKAYTDSTNTPAWNTALWAASGHFWWQVHTDDALPGWPHDFSVANVTNSMKESLHEDGLREGYPLAYFLTFTCYGTHLHGSSKGSVDCRNNVFGTGVLPAHRNWERYNRDKLSQKPYPLDELRRKQTLQAIREISRENSWDLIAAHVRSTHVHNVITAPTHPRNIRAAMKRRSSTLIFRSTKEKGGRRRWTKGGSSRYLWTLDQVEAAVDYVVRGQGSPMEVHEKPGWYWQLM